MGAGPEVEGGACGDRQPPGQVVVGGDRGALLCCALRLGVLLAAPCPPHQLEGME